MSEVRHSVTRTEFIRRQNEKVGVVVRGSCTDLVRGSAGFFIPGNSAAVTLHKARQFAGQLARSRSGRPNVLPARHVLGMGAV